MSNLIIVSKRKIYIILLIIMIFFSFISIPAIGDDSLPDLTINSLNYQESVIEGDEVKIIVKIENQGDKNITPGTNIEAALKIDNNLVLTNSTNTGLSMSNFTFINFSWTAELGSTTQLVLSVEIDYNQIIWESDENNNAWDGFINVVERPTELEITKIYPNGKPRYNKTVNILADVKNNGANTDSSIVTKLILGGEEIDTSTKADGLNKTEMHTFSFNWTPTRFGSQTLIVRVVHEGVTHDQLEKTISVDVMKLEWWNESWHYRNFCVIKGKGNISIIINFTSLLENLGLFSKNFEEDTIRIVEYSNDGDIVGEVEIYWFNKSADFNQVDNALGYLLWDASGNPVEKYCCIYFDVEENLGDRTSLGETIDMNESGDAILNYTGFIDGWWAEITQPSNASYCLLNAPKDIRVQTRAKAESVTAYMFLKENESHNFTVYLSNEENYTFWIYEDFSFDKEGNWTIRITCRDDAEYEPDFVEHDFYVGKPDLELADIDFSTDWPPTSPIVYKDDMVKIMSHISSYYANIEDVKVTLNIYDLTNDVSIVTTNLTEPLILKDADNLVNFTWAANEIGVYNITVTVDPDDVVDEYNETNNQITKKVTVHGWPDLEIKSIVLPSETLIEFDEVEIEVTVANNVMVEASGYEVKLYIEPIEQGVMKYIGEKDSKIIDIGKNTSKKISLFWDSSEPGEWLLGAKVIVNDTKKDINTMNNRYLSNETLKVKGIEKNKPSISSVMTYPDPQEQGRPVNITADITDDTGIDSATIEIISPNGTVYKAVMNRLYGDEFVYIFENTYEVGLYLFEIQVVDLTLHENKASLSDFFSIYEDSTDPDILFFEADPYIQLKGESIQIACKASDNIGIDDVTLTIKYPDNNVDVIFMNQSSETDEEYIYENIYYICGKYTYYIVVTDEAGGVAITEDNYFWITTNLDDIDNDGMPNKWEEKYGLDPEDPTDANKDKDKDGYSNLKEYKIGTNPAKDIFSENVAYRVKENAWYLTGSIILFLLLFLLSLYELRRNKI